MARTTIHSHCDHESTPAARAACRRSGGPVGVPKPRSEESAVTAPADVPTTASSPAQDYFSRLEEKVARIREIVATVETTPEADDMTAFIRTNASRLKDQRVRWETINWGMRPETREGYLVSWNEKTGTISYREQRDAQLMRFIPTSHVVSAALV